MKKIISIDKLNTLRQLFSGYRQIIAVYLFGSRIKGNFIKSSDLDVGILCEEKKGLNPLAVFTEVSQIITDYTPDIVTVDLNDDPVFLIRIINGKVLYQKNLLERISLETRILHLYEDQQAFGRIRKYYLDKSFKEGVYAS